MKTLTPQQGRTLSYFMNHLERNQCQPSIADIGKAIRVKTLQGVIGHLRALETKGYLKKVDSTPRSGYLILKGLDCKPVNLSWRNSS